jgi:hypothetical protein
MILRRFALAALFAGTALAQAPQALDRYTPDGLLRLPLFLDGAKIHQVGSWDESGGNDDGFFYSGTLGRTPEGEWLLVDEEGPGCLYRFQFSSLFARDGARDNVITITIDGASEPFLKMPIEDLFRGRFRFLTPPFVGFLQVYNGVPLGHYVYLPIPFRKSCRVTMKREPYFYNITWHTYPAGTKVPTLTPAAWQSALGAFARLGLDPKPTAGNVDVNSNVTVPAPETRVLFQQPGAGSIQALQLQVTSPDEWLALRTARLRIRFDGEAQPSVDAPLDLFFGIGFQGASCRSLLVGGAPGQFHYCYFPMPFWQGVEVSLANQGTQRFDGVLRLSWRPETTPPLYPAGRAGTFRAQVSEQSPTTPGRDFPFLQAGGKGHMVGVFLAMEKAGLEAETFLEGDERFYVDGARSPAVHGDGTETYFNGAWYFVGQVIQHPLFGTPFSGFDGFVTRRSGLRLHVGDAVPFRNTARLGIESGGYGNVPARYRSVCYAYQARGSDLLMTDLLDVGDAASEQLHDYRTSGRFPALEERAFYPGDDDDLPVVDVGREVPPGGVVRFRLTLTTQNQGVRLVRRMHYGRGAPEGQRARVRVDGAIVGDWWTPGRYYRTLELRPPGHEGSPLIRNEPNKVFRDEEFELPPARTAGRSSVEVTLENTGSGIWSEFEYRAFCYLSTPVADLTPPRRVDTLGAGPRPEGVEVIGTPAADDFGVAYYEFARAQVPPGPSAVIGRAPAPKITDRSAIPSLRNAYTVTAVDHAGNRSDISAPVEADFPRVQRFEGEQLQILAVNPPATAAPFDTFPFQIAGLPRLWSGDAMLAFRSGTAGEAFTTPIPVQRSGRYAVRLQISAFPETIPYPNTGVFRVVMDGSPVGNHVWPLRTAFTQVVDVGEVQLLAGNRYFRFESLAGARVLGILLDYLELRYLD